MSKTSDTQNPTTRRATNHDEISTELADRARTPCFLQLCSHDGDATLDHPDRGRVPVCGRHAKLIPARLSGAEVIR